MKNLTLTSKLALAALSTVLVAAILYTTAWFIIKHNIENSIHQEISSLTSQPSLKSVNYKLETSCFPYICVNLSDVNIKTKKYFSISKEGFEFEIFKKHPLKFKIKNIFAKNVNLNLSQLRYDITSTNLDVNQKVTFITDINTAEISANRNSFETTLNGIFVEVSSNQSVARGLLDIQKASLAYSSKENKLTVDRDILTEVFNLKIFSPKTGKQTENIHHAKLDASLNNLDKAFLEHAKNKESKEYVKQAIENFKTLQTAININDLKFTSSKTQVLAKAKMLIDDQYFLNTNADAAIRFMAKDEFLEKLLTNYGFTKNEKGSYIINVRTDKNIIKVNKNIAIPAPFFKPE